MTTPVAVLSGTLGAGKTTLLNHVLSADHGREVAVLVNDVGDVNVDADLVERRVEGDREVVELSNGCICCGIQGEFEEAIVDLALGDATFDRVVVEPSGISEPASVVGPFVRGHAASFYDVRTVTTVVDARQFADAFADGTPRRRGDPGDDARPISDLLVAGVEFCDALVVNKTDLVDGDELGRVLADLRALQPDADAYTATFGEVDPAVLLEADRFDPDAVADAAGWKRAMRRHGGGVEPESGRDSDGHDHAAGSPGGDHAGHSPGDGHMDHDHADHDHVHPTEAYGVDSLLYERRRPFHPERLAELFASPPAGVLRAKGWIHVADRPNHALTLSLAGTETHVDVAGRWIASMDARLRRRYRKARDPEWDDTYGDRKTELVVLGRDLDGVAAALDRCLLAPEELDEDALSPTVEVGHNPFPSVDGRRVRL